MKVLSIVGARPQFIKAFPVSRALGENHEEVLVHTGQHYDTNLSQVFFAELGLPEPSYQLGIGSAPPGRQIGEMLSALHPVFRGEGPDVVLVYGDTNSTLAGTIIAAHWDCLLAHVEAGLRSHNREMPEEVNRVLTDHAADVLFAPTTRAVRNLEYEGVKSGVHQVGDVMVETVKMASEIATDESAVLEDLDLAPEQFVLATIHRARNTDNPDRLHTIFQALGSLSSPVIYPAHPRTIDRLSSRGELEWAKEQVRFIDPLGYFDFVHLLQHARRVVTDSGGVQKEAFLLETPCITIRSETEWPETVDCGANVLVRCEMSAIREAVNQNFSMERLGTPYGTGDTAEKIVSRLEDAIERNVGVRQFRSATQRSATPRGIEW